jgi:hypothetical protein
MVSKKVIGYILLCAAATLNFGGATEAVTVDAPRLVFGRQQLQL